MTLKTPLLDLALPTAGRRHVRVGHLPGASAALAAAEAAARHPGPVLIVAPSAASADRLEREIAFFAGGDAAHRFPDYETLPYEPISPPQDLLAERLTALYRLARGERRVFIADADALLNRLPPPSFILGRSLELAVGQVFERDALVRQLTEHGYMRVEQVAEPGEFAVRGALLDVFPAGAAAPGRIDFCDDEIEKLRTFDPETQRTRAETTAVRVLLAREFPFYKEGIAGFRRRFRATLPVDPTQCPLYRDISEAQLPAGVEYYLPLFFDETASLLDYLPRDGDRAGLVILVDDASEGLESGWRLVEERYEQLRGDLERPVLPPADAFWPPEDVIAALAARATLALSQNRVDGDGENAPVEHVLTGGVAEDVDQIARWLDAAPDDRTLIVTSSPGHREMLLELLRGRGYAPKAIASWAAFVESDERLGIAVGELEEGLRLPGAKLRVLTAEQLGMERPRQRQRRRRQARDPEAVIRELTDLRVGAPVVHEDYG